MVTEEALLVLAQLILQPLVDKPEPVSFTSIPAEAPHLRLAAVPPYRTTDLSSTDVRFYGSLIGEAPIGRQRGTRPHFIGR